MIALTRIINDMVVHINLATARVTFQETDTMFKTSSILKGLKKPLPSSLTIELIRAHEVGKIKFFKSLLGYWEFCQHFDCGDNSHIH